MGGPEKEAAFLGVLFFSFLAGCCLGSSRTWFSSGEVSIAGPEASVFRGLDARSEEWLLRLLPPRGTGEFKLLVIVEQVVAV